MPHIIIVIIIITQIQTLLHHFMVVFFLLTEEKKLITPSEYGLESLYSSADSRNAPFFVEHASLKRPMYAL